MNGPSRLPDPGLYLVGVSPCPYCRGASAKSNLVIASPLDAQPQGACPVCGGEGKIMGFVPFELIMTEIFNRLGILKERDEDREDLVFMENISAKG